MQAVNCSGGFMSKGGGPARFHAVYLKPLQRGYLETEGL